MRWVGVSVIRRVATAKHGTMPMAERRSAR